MFGKEAEGFLKRISENLAIKWERKYSEDDICHFETINFVFVRFPYEVEIIGSSGWRTTTLFSALIGL